MGRLFRDILTLGHLAWPVVISRGGVMMLSVTDTVMVGRYASEHLAYLGVGLVPHNIFILVMVGLVMGTSVLVSNAFGARNLSKTGEIWWTAMPWALAIGLIGFAVCAFGEIFLLLWGIEPDIAAKAGQISFIAGLSLPFAALQMVSNMFLEGVRNPRPGMFIMLAANVLNVFANYILVYGLYGVPELGAQGSIWATFVVRALQLACTLSYIWFLVDLDKFGLRRRPKFSWKAGAELRKIGYASGLSIGVESTAFNALLVFAGWLSLTVVAAHVITITAFGLFFMVGLGFGVATAVSVGNAHGAGDHEGVRRWAWLGLGIQSFFMLLCALIIIVYAEEFAGFYTQDRAVIALAAQMLVFVSMALVFDTGQSLFAMSLRARGDTWWPTMSHIVAYAGLMMPLTYVSIYHLGRGPMGLADGVFFGTLFPFVTLILRYVYLDRRARRDSRDSKDGQLSLGADQ